MNYLNILFFCLNQCRVFHFFPKIGALLQQQHCFNRLCLKNLFLCARLVLFSNTIYFRIDMLIKKLSRSGPKCYLMWAIDAKIDA